MKRELVSSSSLRSIGYDLNTNTLEVEFQQGEIYQYFEVPKFIHTGLMLATSKGVFFNRNVEDRYSYQEIHD